MLRSNPFQEDVHRAALIERGVLLAPLLVTWRYRVAAPRAFGKWLKTREIILSAARHDIHEQTAGVRYFGTYCAQTSISSVGLGGEVGGGGSDRPGDLRAADCRTLWGFSSEAAMNHMFDLCRGAVARTSIVETDLRDFVRGLKSYIREAGVEHFEQDVMVAACRS